MARAAAERLGTDGRPEREPPEASAIEGAERTPISSIPTGRSREDGAAVSGERIYGGPADSVVMPISGEFRCKHCNSRLEVLSSSGDQRTSVNDGKFVTRCPSCGKQEVLRRATWRMLNPG